MNPAGRPAVRKLLSAAKRSAAGRLTMIGSVVAVRTQEPVVVLTYDDGPEPGGTDAVLEALAEWQATATFFVLVNRARSHPGLLRSVLQGGHEIGLHGMDHRRLTSLPPAEVTARHRKGKCELEDLTGRPVRFVRPAYGHQTMRTWNAARIAGLETVLWDYTTWDWRGDVTTTERVEVAMQAARPGAILLAHDGFAASADGADDGVAPVVDRGELSRRILAGFSELGLRCSSLGGALTAGEPVRRASFVS